MYPLDEVRERLQASSAPASPRVRWDPRATPHGIAQRWAQLGLPSSVRASLADPATLEHCAQYQQHIESLIGTVKIPVGIAGPLRVNGTFASGDYYLPLATTEATLVGSYSRGAQLITAAGGCAAAVVAEGVTRTPGFAFRTLADALVYLAWAEAELPAFQALVEARSRHARLREHRFTVEGTTVYTHFTFETGDAAGQNMITIANEAVCRDIRTRCPVEIVHFMHDANASGEKKANYASLQGVRGRRVIADLVIPRDLLIARLHAAPEDMERSWRMAAVGGAISGSVGIHGHYANGLSALFLACGQDVACVAEAAIGFTRVEVTEDGGLHASVTLPNLIVGTVGGATSLPSQRACLDILGLAGAGRARAFAEVCAAVCLAGELSILAAMSADEFARAHRTLSRRPVARTLEPVVLPNGLEIFHLGDEETEFFYREIFEDLEYLRHGITLRDGDVVVDVGANIGMFSMHAHQLKRDVTVLAFEPIPEVFAVLQANLARHAPNSRAFACALGAREETARFGYYPAVSGMSGRHVDVDADRALVRQMLINQNAAFAATADLMISGRFAVTWVDCPVRRLSDVLAAERVDRVDLLKIDVEKSELDVLAGIDDADWSRIRQIVIEVHDQDGRAAQIESLLRGHGYRVVVTSDPLRDATTLKGIYAVRA